MLKYEYCVFIGRFQPFHLGHAAILDEAFNVAEKTIVVIGSSNKPRTTKNPWSDKERIEMISASLSPEKLARTSFVSMRDHLYNDNEWVSGLQQKIADITDYSDKVALIGYDSDDTSFYLKQLQPYTFVPFGTKYNFHATNIREEYYSRNTAYKTKVPSAVANFMTAFESTKAFDALKQEKEFIDDYKESWRGSPFTPTFVTVDAVVIQSGHVLVVTRKGKLGKGLLALPGGFLNQRETLLDGAIRELKEETAIRVHPNELRKAIVESKVFDSPDRSLRGRTITHAYVMNLGVGPLPQVKGSDDADKAMWLPLSEVFSMESEFFEDHYHIIRYFASRF